MTIDARALAGLEALLFVADEPIELSALAAALETDELATRRHLDELSQRLAERQSGLTVRHVAGGYRLYTDPATDEVVERHLLSGRTGRLSTAALETLAVVAYKQPISRGDISDIRGVNADGAVRSLAQRGLVTEVGRDDGPGQAVLYGTTTTFLEQLGLASLDDLPPLTDYLDDDAPDEPVGPDLREARRALQAGGRLPATGRARWDGEVAEDEPVDAASLRRSRASFGELTDDLERVAQAAMSRLREAMAAAEEPADDADDEPADDGPDAAAPDGDQPPDHAADDADDEPADDAGNEPADDPSNDGVEPSDADDADRRQVSS